MKKVLSFAVVAALFSVAVSCSHDDYNGPTTVSPAAQQDTIAKFIAANGLTNLTKDTAQVLQGYVMSQVINPGNVNKKFNLDTLPVIYFKVSGTFLNGTPFYTAGSTDLWVNFSGQGSVSSQDALNLFDYGGIVAYYLTSRLGEGGSVTFVTPSAYAYGVNPVSFSTGVTIPANTPLYYSQLTIDSIRSK